MNTDVCILGAGPAGAMAALFLAKHNIPCILLEKETFPRDKICGDALSGKVAEVLKKFDPSLLEELRHFSGQLPSWGIRFVAPNLKELKVPFKPGYNTQTDSPPGFIAKRIDFDNFLIEQVRNYPSIKLMENVRVKNFKKNSDSFNIEYEGGEINARLLIVADGAQSLFKRIYLKEKPEPKHFSAGIRAYYKGVSDMDKDNFIELHFLKEFLPGYFWLFPLPNGLANVGIGMRSDIISKRKVNLKEELKKFLDHPHFKNRFSNAELQGEVKGFGLPLGSKRRKISGDNYILTGDAASLIDPFTGEGIGNALLSGMFAAQQTMDSLAMNNFSSESLASYDDAIYRRLGKELKISANIQKLAAFPSLFNLVVNKASSNKELGDMFSCMFTDVDMRKKLKSPSFYFRLLFP
ncbi:MAG: NAD(P)/FAD-dependent oxidoreductase [Cytophagaceae bacterium]